MELRRHFVVVGYARGSGAVTLRCVRDGHQVSLPWRDLRDREEWLPGWDRSPLAETVESA